MHANEAPPAPEADLLDAQDLREIGAILGSHQLALPPAQRRRDLLEIAQCLLALPLPKDGG